MVKNTKTRKKEMEFAGDKGMPSEGAKKDFYRRIPYTYGLFEKIKKNFCHNVKVGMRFAYYTYDRNDAREPDSRRRR